MVICAVEKNKIYNERRVRESQRQVGILKSSQEDLSQNHLSEPSGGERPTLCTSPET